MFKKVFALASVTALTGLVASMAAAGCSSTSALPATAEEAGPAEAGPKKVTEAGPEEEAGPATCPTTETIDATTAPWKSPQALPGSCTEKQIADLVAFVDGNKSTEYVDLKKQITDPTCAACLFVKDGAKWGVFVEKTDGTFLRNNFGGCVAVTSGKDSCGKAFSQLDDCTSQACEDCADETTFTKCTSTAAKGACKTAADSYVTECGSNDAVSACDDLTKTYTFEAAARALCVGLDTDGGTDAGTD